MEHVVAEGEGIALIAWKHGFFWSTLWNLPENSALKETRKNPEVLLAGDRITVPELRKKEIARPAGARHVFRRKGVPSKVALKVQTPGGSAFASKKYRIVAPDATYDGTTSESGDVEHWIAPTAGQLQLTVWLDDPHYPETATFVLRVGHLDPVATPSGVQSRLANLGYDLADEAAALRDVQKRSGLAVTGILDDATRAALLKLHGS